MPATPDRQEPAPADKDDDARTEEARRVAKEYAAGLRELLQRLRKLLS